MLHPSIKAIKQKDFIEVFDFTLLTTEEILSELNKLDPTKSTTGISISLLKDNSEICAPILTNIFNSCIKNGVFPDQLKLADITPIFANSKILVTFMFSLRINDGNRLGVMAYVANNANMTNLARISDYRGSTGNESYRNATGGTDWHSHALFAVDDGSYTGSGGQIPMSTSQRFYNIGYYNASGDGGVYYGDNSQRIYLILQEIKQ